MAPANRTVVVKQLRQPCSGVNNKLWTTPAAVRTDWRRFSRLVGEPDNVALPKSSFVSTRLTIRVWKTDDGTDRRTLRSWRKTAKQPATVRWTWNRMLRSASMKIPRSRTVLDGMMSCGPILNADRGSWCWQRVVAHQSSSVLLVFSWRRLDDIQLCTSSMHADRRCWKSCIAGGLAEPYIWVSSAYRWGQKPCCSTSAIRSAVYMMNKIGPRTEPW